MKPCWTACASKPWPEILREHLDALHALLARLGEASNVNEDALRSLPMPGRAGPGGTAGLVDQLTMGGNLERSLAVVRRSAQPLLAQYLGGDHV